MENYTFWYHHGDRLGEPESDVDVLEEIESDDGIKEMIKDLYPAIDERNFGFDSSTLEVDGEEPNDEARKFYKLLKDSEEATNPGCKKSKLANLSSSYTLRALVIGEINRLTCYYAC